MTFFARRVAIISPVAWRTTPRHYGAGKTVTSNVKLDLVAESWDATRFASGHSAEAGYEEDREANAKAAGCLQISEVFDHAAFTSLKIVPNGAVMKRGEQIGPWYPLLHTPEGLLSIYDGVSRMMDGSLCRLGIVLHDLSNPAVMRGVSKEWRGGSRLGDVDRRSEHDGFS